LDDSAAFALCPDLQQLVLHAVPYALEIYAHDKVIVAWFCIGGFGNRNFVDQPQYFGDCLRMCVYPTPDPAHGKYGEKPAKHHVRQEVRAENDAIEGDHREISSNSNSTPVLVSGTKPSSSMMRS
jgi:hypothetical protein